MASLSVLLYCEALEANLFTQHSAYGFPAFGDMKKIIALIVFLVSCSSHSPHRDASTVFSESQIDSLVQEIMRHTPEYTHYVEGYKFDWVLFTPPDKDPYPAITNKIRSELKQKYTVYDKDGDLPAELISYDPDDPVGGKIYLGGFEFSVEIRRLYENTIEVTYDDFENSMAAGNQTIRYQWQGNRWKVIWESDLMVS